MAAKSAGNWLKKGYWGFVKAEMSLSHVLLLIIRLYWGALLVVAGAGKWANIHPVADYFASLGISNAQVMAYVVASIELLGGLSLIFGLLTRFFSLMLTVVFFTAYFTAHKDSLTSPAAIIKEEPFLYLYASLVVLCFGPGLFSVDYWFEKRSFGEPF